MTHIEFREKLVDLYKCDTSLMSIAQPTFE